MRADDSCRVENAGVKPWLYAAQASFSVSTRSQVIASCAPEMVRAIDQAGLLLRELLGRENAKERCDQLLATLKITPKDQSIDERRMST
jgi:hypothetical protein